MSQKTIPQGADPSNAAHLRTSVAPTINIIHEDHDPFQSDLDLKAKGLSPELARRVCLAAGGKLVGKRILVATDDLRAYLRANPPRPKAPPRSPKTPTTVGTSAEDIARANGLRVIGGEGER